MKLPKIRITLIDHRHRYGDQEPFVIKKLVNTAQWRINDSVTMDQVNKMIADGIRVTLKPS